MAMVSIKRFLDTSAETALRQAVDVLVEGVADSAAIRSVLPAEDGFRAEIRQITGPLTPDLPVENVLALAKSAVAARNAFDRRLANAVEKQAADFQVIIRMLQESLAKVAGERAAAVEGFSRIGEELQRGTAFKDLPALKQHLSGCLANLKTEIERERTASRELIEKLQTQVGNLRGPVLTELPPHAGGSGELGGQSDCIAAIEHLIHAGVRCFAVVMVVNRVQRINARFGRDAGDRMLSRFSQNARDVFSESDRLFRWQGPAFVALLERTEPFDRVRAQIKRMLDTPIQESYEISGRSVLIPISAAWSLMLINPPITGLEKQIETFIASQGSRDFV